MQCFAGSKLILPSLLDVNSTIRHRARCRRHQTIQAGATRGEIADVAKLQGEYLTTRAASDAPDLLQGLLAACVAAPGNSMRLVVPDEGIRKDLHPFLIPLCVDEANNTPVGLLRWPTPPADFDLPVVRATRRYDGFQLELLARSAKDYIARTMATADASGNSEWFEQIMELGDLEADAIYKKGDVDASGFGLEKFLVLRIGPFPDVYEGLAEFHAARGDSQSALITMERACQAFPGWARSHCYHARLLSRLNRPLEARDAARFSLQMPLWTMNDNVQEIAELAGYQDPSSLPKIYRGLAEDERKGEIHEGKKPEQVALDRAAFLLDSVVARSISESSTWRSVREELALRYKEARMPEIARLVEA